MRAIDLVWGKDFWRAVMNMVMNVRVMYKGIVAAFN
jgi:hypothetical protein